MNKLNMYKGEIYNDDRVYLLDLVQAKKGNEEIWTIITRRNTKRFPPTRSDDFKTMAEAMEYLKKVVPTTPLISLGSKGPENPLPYDEYCENLKKQGLIPGRELCRKVREKGIIPAKLEIHELTEEDLKGYES